MISKTQDSDLAAFEHGSPMSIIGSPSLGRMSSAIDFYRELACGAVEIEAEISDNMLAPEFVPGKLSIAETFPENVLCLGQTLPQSTGVKGEEGDFA